MKRNTNYWHKRLALEDDETVKQIEEAVLERSAELPEETPNDDIVHISTIKDEIKEEYDNWGKTKGILTGLPALDEKLGGMGKGHVILIGGETSNGKSAFAANIAVNVARNHGVLFITLEMLRSEIGSRIMHINGGTVEGLDLMFQSEHRLNYQDIKPLMKKAIEHGKVEMVCLDYLQYLGRGMSEKEVAKISKEMKTLALEFQIPFVVIVSLRKSESGKNKRKWTDIEIEDFMGTGAIGYDCDAALVTSRKDLSNEYDDKHIYVKMLKTRNAHLDFNDRYLQFDWDQTKVTEDWTQAPIKNLQPNDGFQEAGQSELLNTANA